MLSLALIVTAKAMAGGRQLDRSRRHLLLCIISLTLALGTVIGFHQTAWADNPGPESGSIGLEGTISSSPPSRAATIVLPSNGSVFTTIPITVSGLCQTGLVVKIFDNNVFVGSIVCSGGSYSLQVDLFSGQNQLVARVYDSLDQAGPDSSTTTVTFNDAQFLQFGTHVSLSSSYAELGAAPGTELDWPIILSGGTSPYAISVDWGDGSTPDLLSVAYAGTTTLKHTYKTAGVYRIVIKATDKNDGTAFLQVIGQATGAIQRDQSSNNSGPIIQKQILWWPIEALAPLIFVSFWVGHRYQLESMQKQFKKFK